MRAIQIRDEALRPAANLSSEKFDWPQDDIARFRNGALQTKLEGALPEQVEEALRCWHTEDDWAKKPELGGWSDVLLNELKDADLRGLGGAGIPATQKWRDVRDTVRSAVQRRDDTRAFIVVNADESEPGTFKDRELLLRTPHLVLEGVILAALVTGATGRVLFSFATNIPSRSKPAAERSRARKNWRMCGPNRVAAQAGPFPVSVFVSPGGYICGEQSALIEAMSDRRGEPRNMPPKLETNGLDDRPTLVSNVETFAWVPYICINSGAGYAAQGVNEWKGRRLFSVSGDVKRPGVYEVPMGLTLRELIYGEQFCQGLVGERKLKGFAPSGPSGGFLPAKLTSTAGLPRDHTRTTNRGIGGSPGVADSIRTPLNWTFSIWNWS